MAKSKSEIAPAKATTTNAHPAMPALIKAVSVQDPRTWYAGVRENYERMGRLVTGTIESLLTANTIVYLSVTYRAKTMKSVAEKFERKQYTNLVKEMTDLCGVRVITYFERDVKRVGDIIRKTFDVQEGQSLDKAKKLDTDRVGYRSVHYVCSLGEHRCSLPENIPYKGLLFEVQVRTVLQHAWAEIEHDRNYKFAGLLPDELKRRLFLIAGTLESADREFNSIANELDDYKDKVAKNTADGDLQLELNSTTINQYIYSRFQKAGKFTLFPVLHYDIDGMRAFGINSIADLDRIFNDELISKINSLNIKGSTVFAIRLAMMVSDPDRYFTTFNKHPYNIIHKGAAEIVAAIHGKDKTDELIVKYNIKTV